jgi:O-glycosyl hydrolase
MRQDAKRVALIRLSVISALALGGSCGCRKTGGVLAHRDTAEVTIDVGTQYQTIDGFGFFGAKDTWWQEAANLYSADWGNLVINDLGITIWRNEYNSEEMDVGWAKQKPVVEGLKASADAAGVPLKFVFSVWSPPSAMKCTRDSVVVGTKPCRPNPGGLKDGGTLDPSKYDAFAKWLLEGVKKYADSGVTLYALSPQNEPRFREPYNSCVYSVRANEPDSYARMIAAVAPVIHGAYPGVKIFGTENMLGHEGRPYYYSKYMDAAGWAALDILAYHGYQDGVAPTPGSEQATYWSYVRTNWGVPHGKPTWMTETSGYTDDWSAPQGARALAYAIYAALHYGQASAWLWWQGSEMRGPNQYSLMAGTRLRGKRYYVSKNFYRYIRPGARAVGVTTPDPTLFIVAFTNPGTGAFTMVAINSDTTDKTLTIHGANIPSTFEVHRTSASEDCVFAGNMSKDGIRLKADSVTTLVNGPTP